MSMLAPATKTAKDNLAYVRGPDFDVPDLTLVEAFQRIAHAPTRRNEEALIFPGKVMDRRWTYDDVDRISDEVAAGFQKRGMKPGDRVALFMPSTPYDAFLTLGVLKAGGVVVNIMLSSKKDRESKPMMVAQRVHDAILATEPDYLATFDVYDFVDICQTAIQGTKIKNLISCSLTALLQPPEALAYRLRESKQIHGWTAKWKQRIKHNLTRDSLRQRLDDFREWRADKAAALKETTKKTAIWILYSRMDPNYFGNVRGPQIKAESALTVREQDIRPAGALPLSAGAWNDRTIRFRDLLAKGGKPEPVPRDPQGLALLQPTSGTSGSTQWVMLSHRNIVCNALQATQHFSWLDIDHTQTPRETMLNFLPKRHILPSTMGLWFPFLNGSLLLDIADPYDTSAIARAVTRYKPTMMLSIPPWHSRMLQNPNASLHDWSSLKAVIPGGAPLWDGLREEFETCVRRPGLMMPGYGMTEFGPVGTSNNDPDDNDPTTVGYPFPGTEIRIMDNNDPDRILNRGEIGLIQMRGPQRAMGYYNDPEATANVFLEDGWLNTGDLGFIDRSGKLAVTGRIKRVVKVNAQNVSAEDVEKALGNHPHVSLCAAVGVLDRESGEAILAVVQLKPGAPSDVTPDSIRNFLTVQGLDSKIIPKYIELGEINVGASGKPDWFPIQEQRRDSFIAAPTASSPAAPTPV